MKKCLLALALVWLGLDAGTGLAQPHAGPGAFDGAMAKLFGDNKNFSATVEIHSTTPSGSDIVMAGNMAYLQGRSRFEMDMETMKGSAMPPQALQQMKTMGMTKMVAIGNLEKKTSCIVYPDLKAYVEMPTAGTSAAPADYKADVTKVGTETVDGHDCVKNKVVVTGPDGTPHESTVWNATDLNKFPVKIEMTGAQGMAGVMIFKNVKLEKPEASQFDVPAGFKKYDNMQNLMMSRMRLPAAPQ